jgi:hypothetical protein
VNSSIPTSRVWRALAQRCVLSLAAFFVNTHKIKQTSAFRQQKLNNFTTRLLQLRCYSATPLDGLLLMALETILSARLRTASSIVTHPTTCLTLTLDICFAKKGSIFPLLWRSPSRTFEVRRHKRLVNGQFVAYNHTWNTLTVGFFVLGDSISFRSPG